MKEITVSSNSIIKVVEPNGENRSLLLDEYKVVNTPRNCLKVKCAQYGRFQEKPNSFGMPSFVIPNGAKLVYYKNGDLAFDEFWNETSYLEIEAFELFTGGTFNNVNRYFSNEEKERLGLDFKAFIRSWKDYHTKVPFYKISIPDDCKLYVCDSSKEYIIFFARLL